VDGEVILKVIDPLGIMASIEAQNGDRELRWSLLYQEIEDEGIRILHSVSFNF